MKMTNQNNPKVFFDVQVGAKKSGRITIELFKDKTQVHCLLARKKSRATRKSTFEVKHPTALVQCEHRFGSKCILLGRNIIYDHHEEPCSVKFMRKMKT